MGMAGHTVAADMRGQHLESPVLTAPASLSAVFEPVFISFKADHNPRVIAHPPCGSAFGCQEGVRGLTLQLENHHSGNNL